MTRAFLAFLILGILLMTAPAVFAQDCLDRLGSNTYTCTHKSSVNANETSSTLEFFGNGNGTWSGYPAVASVACSCDTTDGGLARHYESKPATMRKA